MSRNRRSSPERIAETSPATIHLTKTHSMMNSLFLTWKTLSPTATAGLSSSSSAVTAQHEASSSNPYRWLSFLRQPSTLSLVLDGLSKMLPAAFDSALSSTATAGLSSSSSAVTAQHEASSSNPYRWLSFLRQPSTLSLVLDGLSKLAPRQLMSSLRDTPPRQDFRCVLCHQTTGPSLIHRHQLCSNALYPLPGSCPCIHVRHYRAGVGKICSCPVTGLSATPALPALDQQVMPWRYQQRRLCES